MDNLKQITEQPRSISVAGEADIIVVGGGLAGVAAAVSAARNGSKVILLEKSIILGGLATLGHVCIYLPIAIVIVLVLNLLYLPAVRLDELAIIIINCSAVHAGKGCIIKDFF